MVHVLGVISDTHIPPYGPLPPAIWQHFADVELILHAGDFSTLKVLTDLETIAPVEAVQGNVENESVMLTLPIKREIRVGGYRIGIVHILGTSRDRAVRARQEFPDARIVIFGHSHEPYNQEHDGQLLFNPGSALARRKQPACSIGKLYIDEASDMIRGEHIYL
jgi:putative phosphoesterase